VAPVGARPAREGDAVRPRPHEDVPEPPAPGLGSPEAPRRPRLIADPNEFGERVWSTVSGYLVQGHNYIEWCDLSGNPWQRLVWPAAVRPRAHGGRSRPGRSGEA
jgi:hypothetical protein